MTFVSLVFFMSGVLAMRRDMVTYFSMVKVQAHGYAEHMKAFLKKIVPLPMRVQLKKLGYAWLDFRDPITAPRVPSRVETFIGGGDFVQVGDDFFQNLKRHGLKSTDQVLDVGCGQGRMARPLIDYLSQGHYTGMDIAAEGITWCKAQYDDVPNFEFIHMDVFNSRYNQSGAQQAADYKFPLQDNSQDLTFLTSVFTHMLAADVENYLMEIARTLKPDGTALITWYLLDEVSRTTKKPALDFRYKFDEVSWTTVKSTPEAAIAFDVDFVKSLYAKAGLSIETIEHGYWARPDAPYMLQDMIVARKTI